MSSLPRKKKAALYALDFFCGAGGMSYGLARAGIEVLAGIDNDSSCRDTYEHNNSPARFLQTDITNLSPDELAREIGLEPNDETLILVGCTPCQFWTKINTDRTKSQRTAFLLGEFERFVDWFNPGFVVIENVPGLLSKKGQTRLPEFEHFLQTKKYGYSQGIINANHYGVPQNRRRYLLVATRLAPLIELPPGRQDAKLVANNFIGVSNGFAQITAGHRDATKLLHTASGLSLNNLRRIQATPANGGTRQSWKDHPELQIPAYDGKDGIFRDVYGRMRWDKPAPTITTRFNSLSNGRFGHPEEDRALSLREGATLQTFPKTYCFLAANQAAIARHIGNAVPPALAERIGRHILEIYRHGKV